MSNIRSSNLDHNRIAREAYVRARAAVEAVTRHRAPRCGPRRHRPARGHRPGQRGRGGVPRYRCGSTPSRARRTSTPVDRRRGFAAVKLIRPPHSAARGVLRCAAGAVCVDDRPDVRGGHRSDGHRQVAPSVDGHRDRSRPVQPTAHLRKGVALQVFGDQRRRRCRCRSGRARQSLCKTVRLRRGAGGRRRVDRIVPRSSRCSATR